MDALSLDSLPAHAPDFDATPRNATASLNIGDSEPVALRTAADGSTTVVRLPAQTAASPAPPASSPPTQPDAAVVPVVLVLRNLQRSFLEVQALLQPVVRPAAEVAAQHAAAVGPPVPTVEIEVPWSRRLQQSTAAPLFGIISVAAIALATCGNGVCEFGEATGTWAYPESWNCPQDCPYDLHACPLQVRPAISHLVCCSSFLTQRGSRRRCARER